MMKNRKYRKIKKMFFNFGVAVFKIMVILSMMRIFEESNSTYKEKPRKIHL